MSGASGLAIYGLIGFMAFVVLLLGALALRRLGPGAYRRKRVDIELPEEISIPGGRPEGENEGN